MIQNFRIWWQVPRNIADRPEHRTVTFLELFYDLIYVVLIAQLNHALAESITFAHALEFAFLFILVWWSWLNGTLYYELHGNNDLRTRVFTFLQMITVGGMAVFAGGAMGDTSVGFALSFAAYQLILTFLWWRTGVHDPLHRPLSRPYVITFLVTTALFASSVFVESPTRYIMWIVGALLSLAIPFVTFSQGQNDPVIQEQVALSRRPTPSLVERMGLFTIIVLGEVLVGVVSGVSSVDPFTIQTGLIGMLTMIIGFGLWWLYFDFVSHRKPLDDGISIMVWLYIHLPLTAGITMVGSSILNVIEHADEQLPLEVRWLLVIAIAMVLFSIVVLFQMLETPEEYRRAFRIGQGMISASATLIILLGFTQLEIIPMLLAIIVLLLTPVFFAVKSWIRVETARIQLNEQIGEVIHE